MKMSNITPKFSPEKEIEVAKFINSFDEEFKKHHSLEKLTGKKRSSKELLDEIRNKKEEFHPGDISNYCTKLIQFLFSEFEDHKNLVKFWIDEIFNWLKDKNRKNSDLDRWAQNSRAPYLENIFNIRKELLVQLEPTVENKCKGENPGVKKEEIVLDRFLIEFIEKEKRNEKNTFYLLFSSPHFWDVLGEENDLELKKKADKIISLINLKYKNSVQRNEESQKGKKNATIEQFPYYKEYTELIQNASDCEAKNIEFRKPAEESGYDLTFSHSGGRKFCPHDIYALFTIFGTSKDKNEEEIGKFGIGFYTIYNQFKEPRILSDPFKFVMEHTKESEESDEKYDLRRYPKLNTDDENISSEKLKLEETRFDFKCRGKEKIFSEDLKSLLDVNENDWPFLVNLTLKENNEDFEKEEKFEKELTINLDEKITGHVELEELNTNEKQLDMRFFKGEYKYNRNESDPDERRTREFITGQCLKTKSNNDLNLWLSIPKLTEKNKDNVQGKFFLYLPLANENLEAPIYVNSDFEPDSSRGNIKLESERNNEIKEKIPTTFLNVLEKYTICFLNSNEKKGDENKKISAGKFVEDFLNLYENEKGEFASFSEKESFCNEMKKKKIVIDKDGKIRKPEDCLFPNEKNEKKELIKHINKLCCEEDCKSDRDERYTLSNNEENNKDELKYLVSDKYWTWIDGKDFLRSSYWYSKKDFPYLLDQYFDIHRENYYSDSYKIKSIPGRLEESFKDEESWIEFIEFVYNKSNSAQKIIKKLPIWPVITSLENKGDEDWFFSEEKTIYTCKEEWENFLLLCTPENSILKEGAEDYEKGLLRPDLVGDKDDGVFKNLGKETDFDDIKDRLNRISERKLNERKYKSEDIKKTFQNLLREYFEENRRLNEMRGVPFVYHNEGNDNKLYPLLLQKKNEEKTKFNNRLALLTPEGTLDSNFKSDFEIGGDTKDIFLVDPGEYFDTFEEIKEDYNDFIKNHWEEQINSLKKFLESRIEEDPSDDHNYWILKRNEERKLINNLIKHFKRISETVDQEISFEELPIFISTRQKNGNNMVFSAQDTLTIDKDLRKILEGKGSDFSNVLNYFNTYSDECEKYDWVNEKIDKNFKRKFVKQIKRNIVDEEKIINEKELRTLLWCFSKLVIDDNEDASEKYEFVDDFSKDLKVSFDGEENFYSLSEVYLTEKDSNLDQILDYIRKESETDYKILYEKTLVDPIENEINEEDKSELNRVLNKIFNKVLKKSEVESFLDVLKEKSKEYEDLDKIPNVIRKNLVFKHIYDKTDTKRNSPEISKDVLKILKNENFIFINNKEGSWELGSVWELYPPSDFYYFDDNDEYEYKFKLLIGGMGAHDYKNIRKIYNDFGSKDKAEDIGIEYIELDKEVSALAEDNIQVKDFKESVSSISENFDKKKESIQVSNWVESVHGYIENKIKDRNEEIRQFLKEKQVFWLKEKENLFNFERIAIDTENKFDDDLYYYIKFIKREIIDPTESFEEIFNNLKKRPNSNQLKEELRRSPKSLEKKKKIRRQLQIFEELIKRGLDDNSNVNQDFILSFYESDNKGKSEFKCQQIDEYSDQIKPFRQGKSDRSIDWGSIKIKNEFRDYKFVPVPKNLEKNDLRSLLCKLYDVEDVIIFEIKKGRVKNKENLRYLNISDIKGKNKNFNREIRHINNIIEGIKDRDQKIRQNFFIERLGCSEELDISIEDEDTIKLENEGVIKIDFKGVTDENDLEVETKLVSSETDDKIFGSISMENNDEYLNIEDSEEDSISTGTYYIKTKNVSVENLFCKSLETIDVDNPWKLWNWRGADLNGIIKEIKNDFEPVITETKEIEKKSEKNSRMEQEIVEDKSIESKLEKCQNCGADNKKNKPCLICEEKSPKKDKSSSTNTIDVRDKTTKEDDLSTSTDTIPTNKDESKLSDWKKLEKRIRFLLKKIFLNIDIISDTDINYNISKADEKEDEPPLDFKVMWRKDEVDDIDHRYFEIKKIDDNKFSFSNEQQFKKVLHDNKVYLVLGYLGDNDTIVYVLNKKGIKELNIEAVKTKLGKKIKLDKFSEDKEHEIDSKYPLDMSVKDEFEEDLGMNSYLKLEIKNGEIVDKDEPYECFFNFINFRNSNKVNNNQKKTLTNKKKTSKISKGIIIKEEKIPCTNVYELLIESANWLIENEYLKEEDLPVDFDLNVRYLINDKNENKKGEKMNIGRKLKNGWWVETKFCTRKTIKHTKRLLKKFGLNDDEFEIKWF